MSVIQYKTYEFDTEKLVKNSQYFEGFINFQKSNAKQLNDEKYIFNSKEKYCTDNEKLMIFLLNILEQDNEINFLENNDDGEYYHILFYDLIDYYMLNKPLEVKNKITNKFKNLINEKIKNYIECIDYISKINYSDIYIANVMLLIYLTTQVLKNILLITVPMILKKFMSWPTF